MYLPAPWFAGSHIATNSTMGLSISWLQMLPSLCWRRDAVTRHGIRRRHPESALLGRMNQNQWTLEKQIMHMCEQSPMYVWSAVATVTVVAASTVYLSCARPWLHACAYSRCLTHVRDIIPSPCALLSEILSLSPSPDQSCSFPYALLKVLSQVLLHLTIC